MNDTNRIEENANGSLSAPENILWKASEALHIYQAYRRDQLERNVLYAEIEGLIGGNPPYEQDELEAHGLGHISNFNNLDARALYERGANAHWNLLNGVQHIAKFVLNDGGNADIAAMSEIVSRHWSNVVKSWTPFYTNVNKLTGQLIKFGVSPIIWSDEESWQWRTVEINKFFVPNQASTDTDMLTCVCIETLFPVQTLWQIYDKMKGEKETPWKIDVLKQFLLNRSAKWSGKEEGATDMLDWQKRRQNGDLNFGSMYNDSLRVVSVIIQEYSGKFTHAMVDPSGTLTDYLYYEHEQFRCLDEVVQIFTASPGETTIHGNRGLGHKMYAPCQAGMRLDCSLIDTAIWSGTPLIKSLATGPNLDSIRLYPGAPTNIGNSEFVTNNLGANISQIINVAQYTAAKLNFNLANSGDDPSQPDKNVGSLSPSQARMRTYKEFSVLKNNIQHFYTQFDCVIQEMVIKMLKAKEGSKGYEYVEEWRKLCKEDGVPTEILFAYNEEKTNYRKLPRTIRSVSTSRVAGDGSTMARIAGLTELLPISGSFGAVGAREYSREWVEAALGPEYVPMFLPSKDSAQIKAQEASLAGLENIAIRIGESPVFSQDNEHRTHMGTHLILFTDIIHQIQQGQMTAVEADKMFTVGIPHADDHYRAMKGNPFAKQFLQTIEKPWNQITEYARLNKQNAGKQIQAEKRKREELEANQNQVMSDQQREDYKAQREENRKDFQVQSKEQRNQETAQKRGENMEQDIREKNRIKELDVRLKNQNKPLEQQTTEELSQDLTELNGQTPAPYDIEL